MEEVKLRTLSVLVDNEAGVLSQVSRLFSRKGFNVESLAVGATDNPAISRMTIEVLANQNQTNLMCNQLAKMVPVHSVKLLNPNHSIRRELILYKVRAKNSDDKNEIIQIANIFRGSIIDVSKETLTLSVIGDEIFFSALLYKAQTCHQQGSLRCCPSYSFICIYGFKNVTSESSLCRAGV